MIDKGTKHGSGTSRQRQEDQTSHNKFALLPYQRLSLKAEKKTRGLNRIAYAKHVTTASVDLSTTHGLSSKNTARFFPLWFA